MSGIIGISYERMDESKSKLSRARDAAHEEKNQLVIAESVLQATGSQKLRSEADIINEMIRKVDTRIDNIERVMASIDYSIRRFQEVDAACASRIKNIAIDFRREQKMLTPIMNSNGIFSASSIIYDGSIIGKLLEDDSAKWYDEIIKYKYGNTSNRVNSAKTIAVDTYNVIDNTVKNLDEGCTTLNKLLGIDNPIIRRYEGSVNGVIKFG